MSEVTVSIVQETIYSQVRDEVERSKTFALGDSRPSTAALQFLLIPY